MSDTGAPSYGLSDGTRVTIRSGSASPVELAALLAVLDATAGARAPAAPQTPAWMAAALRESATHPRVSSPGELRGWSWGGWA